MNWALPKQTWVECKAKQAWGWPDTAGYFMGQALAIELQACLFPFLFWRQDFTM